jgi:hypothetical protein
MAELVGISFTVSNDSQGKQTGIFARADADSDNKEVMRAKKAAFIIFDFCLLKKKTDFSIYYFI